MSEASQLQPNPPSPPTLCLECGRPVNPLIPHGVCPDCSLRNLLNASLHQTIEYGSQPLIDHPDKDLSIDVQGQPTLVEPLRSGDKVGAFEIVRRLGRGGMGTVYEAHDTENQRHVALKLLMRPVENEEARQRFLREGRLAASINHPNSVFVFGTHQIDHLSLISMELVNGGTLEQWIREHGAMKSKQAVDAILQIVDGLEAAYERGVLHRDIKPANCFVADDGTIKIGDFGLSISTDPKFDARLTSEGAFLGTPAFSSPEQLRGDAIDVRSDIYALGVTLYYLLTGRTPFQADSMVKLLSQVFESSPPTPASLCPEISFELSQMVMRCLAKEPGDRYLNYVALRKALIPHSSHVAEPASLGWRGVAGLVDSYILVLLSMVYQALSSDPFNQMVSGQYLGNRLTTILFTSICILYYAISESVFGQTMGKKLLGLKTIDTNGGRPTFRQSLLRAAFYILFPMLFALPYGLLFDPSPISWVSSESIWPFLGMMALGVSVWALWGILFSTIRSRNGLAGLHEIVSNTRVVRQFVEPVAHRELASSETPSVANLTSIGPYAILESLSTTDESEMHIGFDTLMLRRVWLRCETKLGSEGNGHYRTSLGRSTRLRWLNRFRDQGRDWDVYEAPTGQSLIQSLRSGDCPTEKFRLWLADLSRELDMAIQDKTLPSQLDINQLWLTDSNRLKLLDFAAPGAVNQNSIGEIASTPQPELRVDGTPHDRCRQMLQSLAPVVRTALAAKSSAAIPPPLSITRMLLNWEKPVASSGDFQKTLQEMQIIAAKREVSSRRRRWMMAAACYVLPVVQTILMSLIQLLNGVFYAKNDDIRQLYSLVRIMDANEPFKDASHLVKILDEDPAMQAVLGDQVAAYHRYQAAENIIAGNYQGILDDPRMMSVPSLSYFHLSYRQQIALAGSTKRPSKAEVDDGLKLLADEIQLQGKALAPNIFPIGMLLSMAINVWMVYTAFPAIVAGLLFRGGLVLHGFESVIVKMDGLPAGRFRIFIRAGLAFIPGMIGIICLLPTSPVFANVTPPFEVSPIAIAFGVTFALGTAIISNCFGNRSIADRVVGTAVVSR